MLLTHWRLEKFFASTDGMRFPFQKHYIIDTFIIHDTLAVIANEVKQSSKTKMHFLKPSGLPRRLRLLMKLLVERLV
ncbi:MAG: hypothetical protein AWT59_3181, partial [Candidatus Gallionella acididurans]